MVAVSYLRTLSTAHGKDRTACLVGGLIEQVRLLHVQLGQHGLGQWVVLLGKGKQAWFQAIVLHGTICFLE